MKTGFSSIGLFILSFISVMSWYSCDKSAMGVSGEYNVRVDYTYDQVPQRMYDTPLVHIDSSFYSVLSIKESGDTIFVNLKGVISRAQLVHSGRQGDTLIFLERYPASVFGPTKLKRVPSSDYIWFEQYEGNRHGSKITYTAYNY